MANMVDAILRLTDNFTPTLVKAQDGLIKYSRQAQRVSKDLYKIGNSITNLCYLKIKLQNSLHDHYVPKIYPNIGDTMYLYDDAIRLSKSKGAYNFKNKTAEAITRIVCNDLGIAVGTLANTGISQKLICSNMDMYEIIKEAYKSAGSQNDKKYSITMKLKF